MKKILKLTIGCSLILALIPLLVIQPAITQVAAPICVCESEEITPTNANKPGIKKGKGRKSYN